MFIRHILGEHGIIEIQSIILIPNESPMQTLFPGIRFKCIEFILYLNVDVFILSMTFTALSLNNPTVPSFIITM